MYFHLQKSTNCNFTQGNKSFAYICMSQLKKIFLHNIITSMSRDCITLRALHHSKHVTRSCLRTRAQRLLRLWSVWAVLVRHLKSISTVFRGRTMSSSPVRLSMAALLLLSSFEGKLIEYEKFADVRAQYCCLFVSMDTGGKVALIGCLAASLFPDGGGAVAALVEQHIGLIGLKLVLCEWSHTVNGQTKGKFQVYANIS